MPKANKLLSVVRVPAIAFQMPIERLQPLQGRIEEGFALVSLPEVDAPKGLVSQVRSRLRRPGVFTVESFESPEAVPNVGGVAGTPRGVRGGPRNSDSLLRWDPDQGEGVWNATEETELSC